METLHIQLLLTLGSFLLFAIIKGIASKVIRKHAEKHDLQKATYTYVNKVIYASIFVIIIGINAFIWDISLRGLSIYFASFFTLFGIAFFAVWSILSNVTASVILFFNTPLRIGSIIKIHDGDNSIEGEVHDFTLFNLQVKTSQNTLVTYPNNLALQKAISVIKK